MLISSLPGWLAAKPSQVSEAGLLEVLGKYTTAA